MAYFIDDLTHNQAEVVKEVGKENKKVWVVARPMSSPFIQRLKDAWLVLTGKADAVKFHGQ